MRRLDFAFLPKVELHLHLDCSLSYQAVSRLRPGLSQEQYRRDFVAPARCDSLAHYLEAPRRMVALLQTPAALTLAVEDVLAQLARDRVIYAELRFAPLLHLEEGMTPEAVVGTVAEAMQRAALRTGVEARLLLCTLRHFSAGQSLATLRLAQQFRGPVAGLDIAGDEAGFALDPHVEAFVEAARLGLPATAHAGEAAGAASLRETWRRLRPQRIGHGVRCEEDAALVEEMRAAQLHLEMCPTSNVQTRACPDFGAHPLPRLLASGLSVGINTDCRAISDTELNREYELLRRQFGWSGQEFLACNLHAIEASFAETQVKQTVAERLREAWTPASP